MRTHIHKECGAEIVWARSHADRNTYMRPLEVVELAYVINDAGVASSVMTYKFHLCDPERAKAWKAYQIRLAKIAKIQKSQDSPVVIERLRQSKYELAVTVDCPICAAELNEPCLNLNVDAGVPIKQPHGDRVEAAKKRRDSLV